MKYKLVFVLVYRTYKGDQQAILTKEFTLPFQPYYGLVITDAGMRWEIAPTSDFYWDNLEYCFFVEKVVKVGGQPPNDIETMVKRTTSQGWILKKETSDEPT